MLIQYLLSRVLVLPAHAGVILRDGVVKVGYLRITRTCGGDPILPSSGPHILQYYPHMRG